MRLDEITVRNRGYRSTPDDDRMYGYRLGSFQMDDGTVYGFKAVETDDGVVADYVEASDDPVATVRRQEYDLDMDDRLPGLEDSHLQGYGEAIAHELSSQHHRQAEPLLEPADD